MTTTLTAPGPTAPLDSPLAGLTGRVRRHAPVALLPMVDVLALATAGLLAGAPGWWATTYACAVLVLLTADGQHRLRICRRISDQVPRTVAVTAVPLLAVLPWAGYAEGLRLGLLSAASLVALRTGACAALRSAHRRGRLLEPALVVGTGATAVRVVELLGNHPELGLAPRGFLDSRLAEQRLPLPLLGEPAELADVVARYGIQRVIVCFPATGDADLVPLLRVARPLPADVCLVPRLYELGAAVPRGYLDELYDIPLVPLRRLGHGRPGHVAKASFDLVGAAALLLAVTPLLLVLAVAVRLHSGHPVLFCQTRITTSGKTMELVKLRSMIDHPDSDTRWTVLPEQTTSLGRWLRSTHLDELPQLANVLRGQMSLVGPRPERPYFAAHFTQQIPRYADRHRMRAGLTGWAQVHGLHGDTSITDRVRLDNHYIEYWSPWMDLMILIRTLRTVSSGGSR
ncbi:MAG TPA: exopolysaccharide biosynthesis polyprenyl glycosylphosphotransferase [Pseudonocardiaceae bacterium]|nr:exopolysaccharide biosynthesis polyprenyl glycosylphosphotransferase [Pseudonocardiaceae bacterium]